MLPQSCCPHNWHVRTFLLFQPLPSPLGYLGESPGSPGSAPQFSAFLRHRGPLAAPQASYAQGSGPSCVVGVREGEETGFPSTLSLPSPSPASSPCCPGPVGLPSLGPWQPPHSPGPPSPKLQSACSFQLLGPWFSNGFLQDSPRADKAPPRGGEQTKQAGYLASDPAGVSEHA